MSSGSTANQTDLTLITAADLAASRRTRRPARLARSPRRALRRGAPPCGCRRKAQAPQPARATAQARIRRLPGLGRHRQCLRYIDWLGPARLNLCVTYPATQQVRIDTERHRHRRHRHTGLRSQRNGVGLELVVVQPAAPPIARVLRRDSVHVSTKY